MPTFSSSVLRTTSAATEYTVLGGRVVHVRNSIGNIHIFYDGSRPDEALFNGTYYRYVHSVQGDILGLQDANGAFVVEYRYDAWGKPISKTGSLASTLGAINPFRYRGYVYDEETGLYYIGARYYNPVWARWISADDVANLGADGDLLSYNLFIYCLNNPINRFDVDGNWSLPNWAKVAIGVGAVLVGAAVVAATGGTAAAVAGAVVAGLKTAAISGAVAAGTSAAITAVTSVAAGNDVSTTLERTVSSAIDGFASGFMWGGISFGASRLAGYITSKTGIFKRSFTYGKNNFMYGTDELTIWRHGPNFRIDASATRGLHYHWRTATTGIGVHQTKWIPEIIGGTAGALSVIME